MLIPSGNDSQRPTNPEVGMFRYNNEVKLFETYDGVWNIIGGVIDEDRDTYITQDSTLEDEDVLRFYTNGNQRMAIFDGDDVFGDISDGTIDQNLGKNTTSGMQGGIAMGTGFNKPESTLHIKGNMIVSSNVNMKGDFFKVTATRTSDTSINMKTDGGMTVDLAGDHTETIGGNVINTIGGNVTTNISGSVNKTIDGDIDETYKVNRTLKIGGDNVEIITGSVDLRYNNNRSLYVDGVNIENYTGSRIINISGDVNETISGEKNL